MDSELKKKIFEQYERLPVALQQAIMSADLPAHFQEITKKYNLLLDQAGVLETETLLILLGFEPYNKIGANLQRELGVPPAQANEIAKEVDEQILQKVREHLMGDEVTEKTADKTQPSLAEEITTLKQAQAIEEQKNKESTIIEIKPTETTPVSILKPFVKDESPKISEIKAKELELIPKLIPPVKKPELSNNNLLTNRLQNTVVTTPERVTLTPPSNEGIKAVNKPSESVKKFDPYREPTN